MLKPADLIAMTPEERTQLFDSLANAFYGSRRTAQAIADDMGYSRGTVFNWQREHTVPLPVIYTLDAWLSSEFKAERIMEDWTGLPAQLSDVADKLAEVSRTMARVARLSGGKPAAAS